MPVRSVIMGGVVGGCSFLLAQHLFDLTLLWALGVYTATGSMTAMLAVSKSMIANLQHGVAVPPIPMPKPTSP